VFTTVNKSFCIFVRVAKFTMEITNWYDSNFESRLRGKYVALNHIIPLLKLYEHIFEIIEIGKSESGKSIYSIKIGNGPKTVLAWSQMHGNETTTTKAIFDFFKFMAQKEEFQKEITLFNNLYSLYVIPILNPDGAENYSRFNANEIDLNRDAITCSQKESKVLRTTFETLQPELCLNLHDQRSIYGLANGNPATISFLAPAADKKRSITPARRESMNHIERMCAALQQHIPDRIGRYDDSFNENCVGDFFQKAGVPTILFEAGHFMNDYQREKPREFLFYAFLELFGITKNDTDAKCKYFEIPENKANYKDVILRNVFLSGSKKPISIAIQYVEVLKEKTIYFEPVIDAFGNLNAFKGHKEIQGRGASILVNSQEKTTVGEKVITIVDKNALSFEFFSRNNNKFL
jgi:hypothetical protein